MAENRVPVLDLTLTLTLSERRGLNLTLSERHGPSALALRRQLSGGMDGVLRTTDFIRQAAVAKGYAQKGVWSLLGKPYTCLGQPQEMVLKIPPLSRDKEQQAVQKRRSTTRRFGSLRTSSALRMLMPLSSTSHTGRASPDDTSDRKHLPEQGVRVGPADYYEACFPAVPLEHAQKRRLRAAAVAGGFLRLNLEPGKAHHDAALHCEEWGAYPKIERALEKGRHPPLPVPLLPGPSPRSYSINPGGCGPARSLQTLLIRSSSRGSHTGPYGQVTRTPGSGYPEEGLGFQLSPARSPTTHLRLSNFRNRLDAEGSLYDAPLSSRSSSTSISRSTSRRDLAQAAEAAVAAAMKEKNDVEALLKLPPAPDFPALTKLPVVGSSALLAPVLRRRAELQETRQRQRRLLQAALWERCVRRARLRTTPPHAAVYLRLLEADLQAASAHLPTRPTPGVNVRGRLADMDAAIREAALKTLAKKREASQIHSSACPTPGRSNPGHVGPLPFSGPATRLQPPMK